VKRETRYDYATAVAMRYQRSSRQQKGWILDEFCAATGYNRKYAIRLLLGPIRPPVPIRRPRAAYYGPDVQAALSMVWSAANGICAKRLVPFLPELVPTLERHGHLIVTDEVRAQLLALSPATVDRLLRPLRQPHGLSATKPGRLLKHQIPVHTFAEWTDVKPGLPQGRSGCSPRWDDRRCIPLHVHVDRHRHDLDGVPGVATPQPTWCSARARASTAIVSLPHTRDRYRQRQ
jgi:hypothetical protein